MNNSLVPTFRSLLNGSMFDTFNSIDKVFRDPFPQVLVDYTHTKYPKLDFYETDKTYNIEINVVGMKKDDISVELKDNYLVLTGEKSKTKNEEKIKYWINELSYEKFYRRILLPENAIQDSIEAKYEDGLLKITLPKLVEEKPPNKKIEIK